jgi:hypothetical protein
MAETEDRTFRERYSSMVRYRNAVNESWEHEARIVKEDSFPKGHPACRILAI